MTVGKSVLLRSIDMASDKAKFARSVVREVVGFSPYERRALEALKVGKDKRALKFLKKRVCFIHFYHFLSSSAPTTAPRASVRSSPTF